MVKSTVAIEIHLSKFPWRLIIQSFLFQISKWQTTVWVVILVTVRSLWNGCTEREKQLLHSPTDRTFWFWYDSYRFALLTTKQELSFFLFESLRSKILKGFQFIYFFFRHIIFDFEVVSDSPKAVLKYFMTVCGEQFVMIIGILLMQTLHVGKLDLGQPLKQFVMLLLELAQAGWVTEVLFLTLPAIDATQRR